MQTGLPPWHLWGESRVISLFQVGAIGTSVKQTQQITRINYRRPETWAFVFYAKITEETGGSHQSLVVNINLTLGIGRSVEVIPAFGKFVFVGGPIAAGTLKYTTVVFGPVTDDSAATPFNPLIDHFSAQDIQVDVDVTFQAATPGDHVVVDVATFFAPQVHVRPEWFNRSFPGGETEGR